MAESERSFLNVLIDEHHREVEAVESRRSPPVVQQVSDRTPPVVTRTYGAGSQASNKNPY